MSETKRERVEALLDKNVVDMKEIKEELPDVSSQFIRQIKSERAKSSKNRTEKETNEQEASDKKDGDYEAMVPKESTKQAKETVEEEEEEEPVPEKKTGTDLTPYVIGGLAVLAFWPQISERLLPGKAQAPLEDW